MKVIVRMRGADERIDTTINEMRQFSSWNCPNG